MRRGPRRFLIGIVLTVAAIVGVAAVLVDRFDADKLKPRIAAMVYRATGRGLAIDGKLSLSLLPPGFVARDVALDNVPGGSRPRMATADEVRARIELLPLLHREVVIDRLSVAHPDVLLERENWRFERPRAAPSGGAPAGTQTAPWSVRLRALDLHDGTLAWTGRGTLAVRSLSAHAGAEGGPIAVAADASLNGAPMTVSGTLGPTLMFPAKLRIASDAILPGLAVQRLDLAAESADAPVSVTAQATRAGVPLGVVAQLGSIGALRSDAPWPVDAAIQAGDARATIKGVIAHPLTLGGADATVTATVPQLAALSPLAGRKLPAVQGMTVSARVAAAEGGFTHGVALRDLHVASSVGDIAGQVALGLPRPTLTGALTSSHLDLDALLAALPHAEPGPAPQPPASAPPPPSPSRPPPPASHRVFSDAAFHLAALRAADANLALNIATLRAGGADIRNLGGHITLYAGALDTGPVAADLPGGHMTARLTLDASQPVPPVTLAMQAPGLQVAPLLALLRAPGLASGPADLDVALAGAGGSAHALAASAGGHIGVSMVGGAIDAAPLVGLLRQASLGAAVKDSALPVRCLAVRADLANGLATFGALSLDTTPLAIDGGGTVNLADETLALRLHPLIRLGGAGLEVPVDVDGPLAAPHARVDAARPADGGKQNAFGIVIGALNRAQNAQASACDSHLAEARGGLPGPAPAPPAAPKKQPKPADLLRSLLR